MIYSKRLQTNIPVTVEKEILPTKTTAPITKYLVKDGRIPVGLIHLSDLPKGVHVDYIENFYPNLYKGFAKVADQIEVEHCMKRGLDTFEINSEAALNSHALHYKRGKRFVSKDINEIIEKIIKNTPNGEKFNTKFLGPVKMYMPKELIEKYIQLIKKMPLLK